jgi:glycosidase
MSARFAGTVGNGRVLARIGRDGSVIGLMAPHFDKELVDRPIHAVIMLPAGRRRIGGRGWKHHLEYVRGTNVLCVTSRHASGLKVERRLAAIGDCLCSAFRCEGDAEVAWQRSLGQWMPEGSVRWAGEWPEGFDPPPLAGATRASVVARVPDLADRPAITYLYARSVLVIAQHHDRSGALAAPAAVDGLLARALDASGERGAARAFFEWAQGAGRIDDLGVAPAAPETGPGATLWSAWQDALAGRRAGAIAALQAAAAKRTSLRLFVSGSAVDLRAHALLLLTIHALIPARAFAEDSFFEHQATAQNTKRARALYAGAFHPGMPEPDDDRRLVAEVRADLDVASVTIEPEGAKSAPMERLDDAPGGSARWAGHVPEAGAGEVSRYRIRVHLRDSKPPPMWASDSDPRPGGQEFAVEAGSPPPPDWARDAICYHVMVDRFARPGENLAPPGDSTALYGGTLDGVRERLDHIAGLGCNVLWLSPVHKSPSHHGYDHEDFLEVEPRYGGDGALVRLVEAAHSRGMRVLLDFVPNHTGRGHHLFRDAIEKDGDASGYYRFWQWPHYYRCFFDVISLPELDTGNRQVQQHLVRAAQHWLTAYGADGIRCDHVSGVDPAFWIELRRGLREVRPEPLILGEATGTTDWLARYAGRLDAIFDFDLAYYMRHALARGNMKALGFAEWLDQHDFALPGLIRANLLDNHDMNRFVWMAAGNVERVKLAATLLLTLPGMPVIYYGTEVGLSQRHDGVVENAEARLPMLWGDDQNRDLLEHFQRLGRMRAESLALRRGERRTVLADSDVFAFARTSGDETVMVALNFSEQAQIREVPGLAEPVKLGPLESVVMEASTIRS